MTLLIGLNTNSLPNGEHITILASDSKFLVTGTNEETTCCKMYPIAKSMVVCGAGPQNAELDGTGGIATNILDNPSVWEFRRSAPEDRPPGEVFQFAKKALQTGRNIIDEKCKRPLGLLIGGWHKDQDRFSSYFVAAQQNFGEEPHGYVSSKPGEWCAVGQEDDGTIQTILNEAKNTAPEYDGPQHAYEAHFCLALAKCLNAYASKVNTVGGETCIALIRPGQPVECFSIS